MPDAQMPEAAAAEVLNLKLDHIQSSVNEIKDDVKELTRGSPLLRIQQLESWRSNINKFVVGLVLAVVGAWATVLAAVVTR